MCDTSQPCSRGKKVALEPEKEFGSLESRLGLGSFHLPLALSEPSPELFILFQGAVKTFSVGSGCSLWWVSCTVHRCALGLGQASPGTHGWEAAGLCWAAALTGAGSSIGMTENLVCQVLPTCSAGAVQHHSLVFVCAW